MCVNKNHPEENWISIILRILMISLFAPAAADKFMGGLDNVVVRFTTMFQDTLLPNSLVVLHARLIPWAESLLVIWLLVGFRLRAGWIYTAFVSLSLAFGMVVAKQYAIAMGNYVYVVIACMGIYFSRYDQCVIGGKKK